MISPHQETRATGRFGIWSVNQMKDSNMYGLANRALKQLVLMRAGPAVWTEICTAVGFEAEEFDDLQQYPDSITYEIVGAASERLDTPAEELLRDFGRHWILFTSQSRYGDFYQQADGDLEEFLHRLNGIHEIVAESMPELLPPNFGVEVSGSDLIVFYVSDREGLEPMVLGLLDGLMELFDFKGEVSQIDDSEYRESRFLISIKG
ncbi:MAG: heme NO-binding domain-containing protein [Proteobacteria bacterium]|nr:heme NO-binding domain-containing protein [Pseudomonadota bacterium]